jgi:hypothetical protein
MLNTKVVAFKRTDHTRGKTVTGNKVTEKKNIIAILPRGSARVNKFSKNLARTSKFCTPEG